MKPIPYGRQEIDDSDINAVVEVLKSDFLTQGPAIGRFENAVANYCGTKHAYAVSNATAALHILCVALDLGPGDTLWTSPNTFVASANCALYCGARVDFVDIDPRTYNMSVEALEKKLALAKQNGTLPKIVVPVHFAGQSCDMEAIAKLAKAFDFKVVEDASHAVGGEYKSKRVGSCQYSDAAVFSFHPVKILTTGEGGMILTNNSELGQKIARLRTHGITRDPKFMSKDPDGPWYYEQIELGFNARMTDIQAALGESQFRRIEDFLTRRRALVKKYDEALSHLPVQLPTQVSDTKSAHHLYVIRLQLDKISKTHRQVFETLQSLGIMVNLHYIPVHLQPYYQQLGFRPGQYPEAEQYYREAISLPLYAGLGKEDLERVIQALERAIHSK